MPRGTATGCPAIIGPPKVSATAASARLPLRDRRRPFSLTAHKRGAKGPAMANRARNERAWWSQGVTQAQSQTQLFGMIHKLNVKRAKAKRDEVKDGEGKFGHIF